MFPSRPESPRRLISLVLSLILALPGGCRSSHPTELTAGRSAPAFLLPAIDGGLKSLDDFRGKLVLLNFFASWCDPCIEEAAALQQLHREFEPQGFSVVSIATDDKIEDVKAFKERFAITFPILLDDGSLARGEYQVSGFPESFLLDPEGRFLVVNDPEDGRPTVRIIGPRSWSGAAVQTQIKALIKKLFPRQS